MKQKALFLFVSLLIPLSAEVRRVTEQTLNWRCAAWWGPEGSVEAAKELGFNAIIAGFFGERLTKAVKDGTSNGVDIYLDIEFLGGGKYTQVMTDDEEELIKRKRAASAPDVATWEPGKRGDPLGLRLWCFARPEAIEHGKKKIRQYLPNFDVHGVCLDAIGYRNQYGCFCEFCRKRLQELAEKNPDVDRKALHDRFSEQSLSRFITELAEFARKLSPGVKIAVHIEPTFVPNPTFASKLPIDYWMTSVSYYSKPHWPLETVRKLSRLVADAPGKAVGVPYIGFIAGKSAKSAKMMAEEVQAVRVSGSAGIALFELGEIVKSAKVTDAVKEALADRGKD
jgi:hypothetical protein